MKQPDSTGGSFVLRFQALQQQGQSYAFPCDAQGHVDLEALSEPAREAYLYARVVIGRELAPPAVREVQMG
jgi:hypothetical protein